MGNVRFFQLLIFFQERFCIFAVYIPIVFSLLYHRQIISTDRIIVEMVNTNHRIDLNNQFNLR